MKTSSTIAFFLSATGVALAFTPAEIAFESKKANDFFEKSWDETLSRHPVDESYYGIKTHYNLLKADCTDSINHYIVVPSQATAYKIGMLKILELREKAKKSLGDKFDIRQFHEVVLSNGSVPLDVLEELVDRWIKSKQAG
jgi:hypothetical protein